VIFVSIYIFYSSMLLEKTPTTAGIVIFVSIYIFYSSMLLEKTPTTAGNCCISVSLFVRVVGENSNNGGKLLYIRQFIRPCCWRKLQQRRENCCISVSLFVRVVGENSNNGGNIRQFIRPCCWRKLQQRQEKMFYKYIILF
jgi:hypothetical protein